MLGPGMPIQLDGLERLGADRVDTYGERVIVAILDPDRRDLDETSPKRTAVAQYADKHSDGVRNVLAVIKNPAAELHALDQPLGGAEKHEAAENKDLRLALFEPEGMSF
jgi:hypothetical protein